MPQSPVIPIGGQRFAAAIPMNAFADLHGSARQDVLLNRVGDESTNEFHDTRGMANHFRS